VADQDPGPEHRRLRALLLRHQDIVGDLDLDTVLERVLTAACELVDAPYGALGVLTEDRRGLERFVHVGLSEAQVAAIAHRPEGKGLLGALIDDPEPIRLDDVTLDARSVGFPEGHPPMEAFLGVPVRVAEEVYGNLYLAKDEGAFTVEDQEVLQSLASTAGIAVANARLFELARQREHWLDASTDITRRLLTDGGEGQLQLIAEYVHRLADADIVTVALPEAAGERLRVAAAVGAAADRLAGRSYSMRGAVSKDVLASGHPILVDDADLREGDGIDLAALVPVGAVMVLPLIGSREVHGTLVIGRHPGRRRFTDADVDMATRFATHAAVAVELAEAREGQQRVLLWEDRARIARDLHDHVVQQLFASGMMLQGLVARTRDDDTLQLIDRVLDGVDDAIKQIRTSIFQLRPQPLGRGGLREGVLEVVEEVTPGLGFEPHVLFSGPTDLMSGADLISDVRAVMREALTNVARHAAASRCDVSVHAGPHILEVSVVDDGTGLGAPGRRSGLENLRQRAELRGGEFSATQRDEGGTALHWSARVDDDET
jgi:signal transduction histidine kinase